MSIRGLHADIKRSSKIGSAQEAEDKVASGDINAFALEVAEKLKAAIEAGYDYRAVTVESEALFQANAEFLGCRIGPTRRRGKDAEIGRPMVL
jgi:hypothetical protein